MTETVEYPLEALLPSTVSMALFYGTQPGPEATNGMRRSYGYAGAQFRIKMRVPIYDSQSVRAMRALLWNLEGDTNLIRLPFPDLYGIDGPLALSTKAFREAYPLGIPFATDALYATGVGHAVPTLTATLTENVGLNERFIYADVLDELPGGCAISIDDFCYGIAGSWMEDGVNRLKLSPPLRKAAAADTIIQLAPVLVGTCVTEQPGYETLERGEIGYIDLEFVEDLTRLVESII